MVRPAPAEALHEQLARWTAAGLIDAEQAGRIETAEADAAKAGTAPRRKSPLVVEALGYLGAVIALAAGAVAVAQIWKHVPVDVKLALAAAAAAGLIAAGAVLRADAEPAFARLRAVLWLLGAACVAGFAAVLGDSVLGLSDSQVPVLAAASFTACAAPLWWLHRSALQHVALYAGVIAVIGTCFEWANAGGPRWPIGLAFWLASALWGLAGYRGLLAPRTVSLAVACVGLLVGAFMTMDLAAGQALAAVTVAGLLAAGVALHSAILMGFGAAGTVWVVPQVAGRYLPGSVAAPLAVAVVGLALLAIALWLAKTRKRA